MTFDEILAQIQDLLQREQRVSYRGLKRRFALDDEYLEDLKEELIGAKRLAIDEDGRFLVWVGPSSLASGVQSPGSEEQERTPRLQTLDARPKDARRTEAERRQLTVMFCDLVDSTVLSERLDPEELREVVQAYHAMSTEAITRYAGYTAQHLGDGLLVYFGYPTAHEDEAARAVRTALEILAGLHSLNAQLKPTIKVCLPHPLRVRIGIHTGLVVIGEIGSSEKREILALGETPNLAARLQGLAAPDTGVISQATHPLVQGLFEFQDLGPQILKGLSSPVIVYRVIGESTTQSRFAAATQKGLTPLVGRAEELALLRRRWAQAKGGAGQVVLLSGEPGIGKSRLVQELKEHLVSEGAIRIEFHYSPYYQNSAFYPIIDHLQRLLRFVREDTPATKLEKLQHRLSRYRFPQTDTLPLFAALLSLPHPEGYSPIAVSPQKQKEQTQAALVAWLVEETEHGAVCVVWEDLHWTDPSTLEVLTLLLEQTPTARMLTVLTSRPEFVSPWGSRSYLTQLTLSRLERGQVEAMVEQVTGDKALPTEVVREIIDKTDGVPLFVEELTKNVVEQYGGAMHASPLPLGIPATLQDTLMARLDRLNTAKEIAQLGATIGREFSYEVLHAVSPLDEEKLQQGLKQLIDAELLYQRGLPPQATYLFKHALIQDTAYQSLLKSKRQQLHQQIAQVLEGQFPDLRETQPELVAHHYTEAGLAAQAVPYWQKAGQRAVVHSANIEAVAYITKGLTLLKTLPETPDRLSQELALQIGLAAPLGAVKGFGAPELEATYNRARELCQQVGGTPQLLPTLVGLCAFYEVRGELQTALELEEQLLRLAQQVEDPVFLVWAHYMLGDGLFWVGEFVPAHAHVKQSILLYDTQKCLYPSFPWGVDSQVASYSIAGLALWHLGYPDQAVEKCYKALTHAQKLAHPLSLATAFQFVAVLHQYRREVVLTQERAETAITLSHEHGFPFYLALGTLFRGWALTAQGQEGKGIAQIHQGIATWRATGAEVRVPSFFALLAYAYQKAGRVLEGLSVLTEALPLAERKGEHFIEAELYRLKGELTLQKETRDWRLETSSSSPPASSLKPQISSEGEACFLKALEVSRKQQAKSLELRATMSLARLWRSQGKKAEARQLLSEIYNWFTEGFDTKDLQEAKKLLEELGH